MPTPKDRANDPKRKPYNASLASMDKMLDEKDAKKYSKGGTNYGNAASVESNGSSSWSSTGNYRPQG
jgi:hypothetical protein